MEDLGDLLHEIDRDRDLDDTQRAVLQDRLYRLIWERAQPRLRSDDRPGRDGPEHGTPDGTSDGTPDGASDGASDLDSVGDSDGEGGGSLGG